MMQRSNEQNAQNQFERLPIDHNVIKDLADIRSNYSALMFYMWVMDRFGRAGFTLRQAMKEYERTRRTIYRYTSALIEMEMLYKSHQLGPNGEWVYKIVGETDAEN